MTESCEMTSVKKKNNTKKYEKRKTQRQGHPILSGPNGRMHFMLV
jgi:hypothetical protein